MWHGGVGEEGEARFDNVSMPAFGEAIVLRSVGGGG